MGLIGSKQVLPEWITANALARDGFENHSSITDGTWYSSRGTFEGFCPGNLKEPVISDLL